MDISEQTITLHPQWLGKLFAHKSKSRAVFNDVLALYDVNHIAIAYINKDNQLLTLSSTPSLEYNMLSSTLWQYDNTYNPEWFRQCKQASWQSLYPAERYDELYYIKQIKPHYPIGLSMATKLDSEYVIYSIASTNNSEHTHEIFENHRDKLYQIAQYCMIHLRSLLIDSDADIQP